MLSRKRPDGPVKIAVLVRRETLDRCTAKGCLNAFFERIDSFEGYGEEARLVSFTQDGGDLEDKIAKWKRLGVEVVHLSSCVRGKSPEYEALAERLSREFEVVGYTHGLFHGRTKDAICLRRSSEAVPPGAAPAGRARG